MEKQMNVPTLRFPEFEGEWENDTLDNLTERIGDGLHGTPKYVSNSDIYFINGNNLIEGCIQINSSTKKVSNATLNQNNKSLNDKTILISINGTIGSIARYNNEKVMLGKSVGYFNFKENPNFFYFLLNTSKIQNYFISELTGSTIKNLSLKTLRETQVFFPKHLEQSKISSFFSEVDEKTQALKKKKALLEAYKKGVMQQLFLSESGCEGLEDDRIMDSNDEEKNPTILKSKKSKFRELRFKDENGQAFADWEVKKLGEVAKRKTLKNKEANSNVLTISAQFGLISQLEFFNKSVSAKDVTGYYLIEKSDFAYNKSYSNGYPMGAIKCLNRYDKGVVSTLYICFKFIEGINTSFMEHFFETGIHNSEIEKVAQEGARNHGLLNIGLADFFNIEISLPCLKEQTRIANFLSAIDDKIKHTDVQIEKMGVWKKGLLQQMFV